MHCFYEPPSIDVNKAYPRRYCAVFDRCLSLSLLIKQNKLFLQQSKLLIQQNKVLIEHRIGYSSKGIDEMCTNLVYSYICGHSAGITLVSLDDPLHYPQILQDYRGFVAADHTLHNLPHGGV